MSNDFRQTTYTGYIAVNLNVQKRFLLRFEDGYVARITMSHAAAMTAEIYGAVVHKDGFTSPDKSRYYAPGRLVSCEEIALNENGPLDKVSDPIEDGLVARFDALEHRED